MWIWFFSQISDNMTTKYAEGEQLWCGYTGQSDDSHPRRNRADGTKISSHYSGWYTI